MLLTPAVACFMAWGLARAVNLVRPGQLAAPAVLPPVLFVLSAITAIAGPLFLRTLFAHTLRF